MCWAASLSFEIRTPAPAWYRSGADILVGDKREAVLLEAVSVPLRVIDELLRQENVAWFGEGLDARSDDDDVGNFWVLRAFQSRIEFPEPAMRAHSHLQIVSGGQRVGRSSPRAARNSLPGLRSAKTRWSPADVLA